MELRQLRYFVAVADEMHFGRAAEKLYIVQPALSRQIANLERELGFKLLHRTTHQVGFTPAGELLYKELKASLQRIDKAVASAARTATGELGTIAIGYVLPAMWSVLLPILREYRRRQPEMRFDLLELDGDVQLNQLREGLIDVGFVRPSGHDDALAFETIWREELLIALPANHPMAACDSADLSQLGDETFIVMNRRRARVQHDFHFAIFREHGISPDVIEGNTPAALNLVALGVAVALAPASLEHIGLKGVVFRPLAKPCPPVQLAVVYRRDETSPAVHVFLEIVREVAPKIVSVRPSVEGGVGV